MSEIPEDIMKTAREAWYEADGKILATDAYVVIARALMAERDRCAKIAETGMHNGMFQTAGDKRRAGEIAAAIRKGTP